MVLPKYLQDADGEEVLKQTIELQQCAREDLQMGPPLGSGSFGRVYRAKWKGAAVAVKIIRHQGCGTKTNGKVSTEVMIGRHAIHPNVVAVYDVLTQPHRLPGSDECTLDDTCLETLIIMERADRGTLEDQLERLSKVRKEGGAHAFSALISCLLDVVYGLEYLHSLNIIHGDLKPANVLCKSSGSNARGYICKLCDFGLASSNQAIETAYTTGNGTLLYASPERLKGESLRQADDIYAFGILAWQMLDDDDVQAHMPHLQLVHQVLQNDWRPDFPADTPLAYKDMVQSAWASDASKRPTFTMIRKMLDKMAADMP